MTKQPTTYVCHFLTSPGAKLQRVLYASASLFLLTLLLAPTTHALERANLTDKNLATTNIRFVSLASSTIKFFDNKRRLQEAPLADYINLTWTDNTAPIAPRAAHTLRLADGHILPGAFSGISPTGAILWETKHLGQVAIELDSLLSFTIATIPTPKDGAPEPKSSDDVVTLANGDQLTGFIDSLTAESLVLQTAGQNIPLSWDRIAAVKLANPLKKMPGHWLNLTDGTTLLVTRLTLNRQRATARFLADLPLDLSPTTITSIDFSTHFQLIPLSNLEYEIISGGSVFAVQTPPRSTTNPNLVHLHAPISVRYELPRNATRFAALAYLDKQDLQWANLILAIADSKTQHLTQHLTPKQPQFQINIPLTDRHLTFTLDEAKNGPIRDRLKLANAAVLVPVD